jgi:uncharacterized protein (DUF983 family)
MSNMSRIIIGLTALAVFSQWVTAFMAWDDAHLWFSTLTITALGVAVFVGQMMIRLQHRHLICMRDTIIELKKQLKLAYGGRHP